MAAVLALGLGASACGGDESEEPLYVSAGELCNSIFSGDAAAAVETTVGDTTFFSTGDVAPDRVVEKLKEFYADGQYVYGAREFCVINGKKRDAGRIDISFALYKPDDLEGGHAADQRFYELGKLAVAGAKKSSLYFECVSPQLDGSDKDPARILGSLSFKDRKVPETQALREANLTVLHAASFALAKKLECENNGGLPEKVVLKPKPEPEAEADPTSTAPSEGA
ncbi:hypothetical protein [Streptomyces sp. NPDC057617]|uniref:hypothetical protein n=1 Tax=Streptomyces sp. NPDC057617 TaxID=3346184 RepID=UPI0036B4F5B3